MDTTAPSASASCIPSSVVEGSTVNCGCTNSDVTSGVSSFTADSTPSTLTKGTFTYSCVVIDNAGNSASDEATYIVLDSAGTGPGGSPSGTTIKTNLWPKVTPGTATIMKNIDGDAGIKQIQVEVKSEVQNVKITVTKHDNKPAEVSVEKTKNYRYLQIETENLEDELEKAIMTIQVERTWMSDNGIDRDNVALFRFNEDSENWDELTTTYTEEDDTYYYYDIELTSFSYFAISAKVVEGEEPFETGEPEEQEKADLTWLWIVIGVLVLAAIIGGGIAVKKKTKQ